MGRRRKEEDGGYAGPDGGYETGYSRNDGYGDGYAQDGGGYENGYAQDGSGYGNSYAQNNGGYGGYENGAAQNGGGYGNGYGQNGGGYGAGYAQNNGGYGGYENGAAQNGGYGNGYGQNDGGYGNGYGQNGGYGNGYGQDGGGYGNGYGQNGGYGNGYAQDDYGAEDMAYESGRAVYGNQGGNGGTGGRKNRRNKKRKKRRKLVFILELIVLLIAALGIFAFAQLSRVDRETLNDILVNTGVSKSGYRNIALFGVDSREGNLDSDTRSDTIMVASINNKTGEIRIVSVYRDTYLATSDDGNGNRSYHKATECYQSSGAEGAVNMLNRNLDLDISDFVTVDFSAVIEVVDALGGIDIELTDEEVQWLNAYLVETSEVTGKDYTEVSSSGVNHLTGIQAMAYCRIRYTEGWDYKRTERQRLVLEQIFKQAQAQGVVSLVSVVNQMIPYIKTSLSNTEMLSLAANIGKYSIGETQGFPFDKTTADLSAGDCVVPVNLANNVVQLHQFLFDDADYTPSDTVQTISNEIIYATGIQ